MDPVCQEPWVTRIYALLSVKRYRTSLPAKIHMETVMFQLFKRALFAFTVYAYLEACQEMSCPNMVGCSVKRMVTVQSFAWSSCSVFAVFVLYKPPERLTLIDLTRNLSIWLLSITTTFVLNSWNEFFKFRACALGYEWINVFPNAYAQSEKLVLVLWRSVLVAKMLYFSFLSVPFLSLSNLLWRLPNASRHIGGNRNLCFCISIYKRWKIFAMKIC